MKTLPEFLDDTRSEKEDRLRRERWEVFTSTVKNEMRRYWWVYIPGLIIFVGVLIAITTMNDN